mmetsp:Transcript_8482/g.18009  ORF Transcript_8482/g.18009 Transcript_8482/m.18009 type:complete len:246 (-) Transcript_8482:248-985(-)
MHGLLGLGVEDLDAVVALVNHKDKPARVIELNPAWMMHRPKCVRAVRAAGGAHICLARTILLCTQERVLRGRTHLEFKGPSADVLGDALCLHCDREAVLAGLEGHKGHFVPAVLHVLDGDLVEDLRTRHGHGHEVAALVPAHALAVTRIDPDVRSVVHLEDAQPRSLRVTHGSVSRGLSDCAERGNLVDEVLFALPEVDHSIGFEEEDAPGILGFALLNSLELPFQHLDLLVCHPVDLPDEIQLA